MECVLADQVLDLGTTDHLCLFHEGDPAEQLCALVPFIQEGLCRNEQCIYLAGFPEVHEFGSLLEQNGVDPGKESKLGRLRLWTPQEWRQWSELDSNQNPLQLRQTIAQASAAGFKGIRVVIEMTSMLGPDIRPHQLEEWEAALNNIFVPTFPGRIICQYNSSALSPGVLLAALHTHVSVGLGEEVYPNLFYQPPSILQDSFNGRASKAAKVEWMISQLRGHRLAERQREELAEQRIALAQAKLAVKKIERSEERLERAVALRTAELEEANAQLQAFVYSIAHDLRAPLRSMQAFASILLEEYAPQLDQVGQQYASRIAHSAQSMDALLLDLLSYARVARSDMALAMVEVETVWAAVLAQSEHAIAQRQAVVEAASPLPRVRAHEATLALALGNLLENALKFVAGGVTPRVRIWAEEKGDVIRLWVQDNGIGIGAEHQERIFNLFERLNGKDYPGTGIGLSIVRKGIERMGGRIGLESAPGHGTRFWIELGKG